MAYRWLHPWTRQIADAARLPGTRKLPAAVSLRLEQLEERCLLSSTLSAVTAQSLPVAFVVASDHGLIRHDVSGWSKLGDDVLSVSAVADAAGHAVVFAVTTDHALAENDNGAWQIIGDPGSIKSVSAGTDLDGRADAFVLTAAGDLTEWRADAGWLASPIGSSGTILCVNAVSDNAVVVVTADHSIEEYNDQFGWFPLTAANFAKEISSVTDSSGSVTVFAMTQGHALFRHDAASGWKMLGAAGTIQTLSAGTDDSGLPDVFVITTGGDLAEFDTAIGWTVVQRSTQVKEMSAAGGGLLFAIFGDGSIEEYTPGAGFSTLADANFAGNVKSPTGQVPLFVPSDTFIGPGGSGSQAGSGSSSGSTAGFTGGATGGFSGGNTGGFSGGNTGGFTGGNTGGFTGGSTGTFTGSTASSGDTGGSTTGY